MSEATMQPIKRAIRSRYPLIYLHTPEEDRVEAMLTEIAGDQPLVTWCCTNGLDDRDDETRDPVIAIQSLIREQRHGLFLFKDLPEFMEQPEVVRSLRDLYHSQRNNSTLFLFIVSPRILIPETLKHAIAIIELPPPDKTTLQTLTLQLIAEYTDQPPPEPLTDEIARSLQGLTMDDSRHLLHQALSEGKLNRDTLLIAISNAKKSMISGSGFLEYVATDLDLQQMGGLGALKQWISDRSGVFNSRAVESGFPVPKGILLMGISGCGKSLAAKIVSTLWRAPLFRLDMNLIFADLYGNPEATFHQALKTVESLAPAILWIDEIENGLGLDATDQKGTSRILSAFLTWMQEKPPLVFVAATANRIEALPAEMIRKGRFDQIFFCDLPNQAEREEILSIHIRNNRQQPTTFDLARLGRATDGWNSAEIETVVAAARIDVVHQKRPFTTDDLLQEIDKIVPLSQTMSEQIQFIRDWAWDRATSASSTAELDLSL